MNLLKFPAKKLRSVEIKKYMESCGLNRCVCFSCGNAVSELRAAGVDVLGISPNGEFTANAWMKQSEIKNIFCGYFDATSGHLPIELMNNISNSFREYLGDIAEETNVPTGSGETIVCLAMAYPHVKFNAVYGLNDATKYEPLAPLNQLVKTVANAIVIV